ncbi:MAG: hypothetical protein CMJ83_00965 [Planctomycetes bacterium]|jgi:hypothetical protein|nr:hypothetical protein [Planctomycetota bacterium]
MRRHIIRWTAFLLIATGIYGCIAFNQIMDSIAAALGEAFGAFLESIDHADWLDVSDADALLGIAPYAGTSYILVDGSDVVRQRSILGEDRDVRIQGARLISTITIDDRIVLLDDATSTLLIVDATLTTLHGIPAPAPPDGEIWVALIRSPEDGICDVGLVGNGGAILWLAPGDWLPLRLERVPVEGISAAHLMDADQLFVASRSGGQRVMRDPWTRRWLLRSPTEFDDVSAAGVIGDRCLGLRLTEVLIVVPFPWAWDSWATSLGMLEPAVVPAPK